MASESPSPRLLALNLEGGASSLKPRGTVPLEAGRGRHGFSLESADDATCCHLGFSSGRPFQASGLQNEKKINLCCFKPLHLW